MSIAWQRSDRTVIELSLRCAAADVVDRAVVVACRRKTHGTIRLESTVGTRQVIEGEG